MSKLKIYQFKRERATIGDSHRKYFCEIEAPSKKEAIKIIKSTPINKLHWRWIDSYGISTEVYDEVLFECTLT